MQIQVNAEFNNVKCHNGIKNCICLYKEELRYIKKRYQDEKEKSEKEKEEQS